MRIPSFKAFAVAAALACVGAIGVRALRAAPAADRARGGTLAALAADLHVTPEQRRQVRQVILAHRDEIAAVARPLVDANRELRKATLAEPADADSIRAAADALGKRLGDAATLAGRMKGELKATMTTGQIETLGTFWMGVDDKVDAFLDRLETGGK